MCFFAWSGDPIGFACWLQRSCAEMGGYSLEIDATRPGFVKAKHRAAADKQ
jgi:hypothetical protein